MVLDYIPEYVSEETRRRIEEMAERETPPSRAPGPVCEWLIRHWCETVEDGNPLYLDEEAARKAGFPGLVSPPAMLGTWLTPFRWPSPPGDGGGEERPAIHQALKELLELPVGIQVDQEIEFYRPLTVGDVLTSSQKLAWITPPKKTRLGEGHFWAIDTLFRTEDGEVVARSRSTMFGYGRGTGPVDKPKALKGGWNNAIEEAIQGERTGYRPPDPVTRYFEDVHEGDDLPTIVMPITVTRCVYLASATRDFSPQHHNRDYAQQRSRTRDMFLNTPFLQGMIGRALTEWAGPEGRVRRIKIAMRENICVGDDLIIRGRVTHTYRQDGQNLVDVSFDVGTQHGPATSAEGTIALPSRAAA